MKLTNSQTDSIDEVIDLDAGQRVVRLNCSGEVNLAEEEHNFNIYCIDKDNNIIWRVDSDSPEKRDSFVSIEFKNNQLMADRFFGSEYCIDISTGVARKIGWHK